MDLNTLKRRFLEHIEIEKGRSLKTVENYDHYLVVFFEFAKIKNAENSNKKHKKTYHTINLKIIKNN